MTTVAERVSTIRVGSHALRVELLSPFLRERHRQRRARGDQWPARGLGGTMRRTLSEAAGVLKAGLGFGGPAVGRNRATNRVPCSLDHLERFEWLYDRLADDHSRGILVEILRARVLGRAYVAPAEHAARYKRRRQSIKRDLRAERAGERPSLPQLGHYRLRGPNGSVRIEGQERNVLHTFLLERYAYLHDDTTIRARPGDVVIDGGSHWGDAALYFADLVGGDGRVYAIEHAVGDAAIVAQNLTMNPRLLGRVRIVEAALGARSGERVSYEARGPVASLVRVDPWGRLLVDATTVTIDDLVEHEEIQRVDFLKLDAGSAELQALMGARETIRTHRPTLAVALHDDPDDLVTIPSLLDDIASGFDFFLDDVTLDGDGTILFARPRPERRAEGQRSDDADPDLTSVSDAARQWSPAR